MTDNGSNFVKAFKIFGITTVDSDGDNENENDDEYEDDHNSEDECIQVSLPEEATYVLPKHLRCCAHTLNLSATTDTYKGIQSSKQLLDLHKQVMLKCKFLWNAASRPKTAEIIHKILGCT